jgi:hypothetical protein
MSTAAAGRRIAGEVGEPEAPGTAIAAKRPGSRAEGG